MAKNDPTTDLLARVERLEHALVAHVLRGSDFGVLEEHHRALATILGPVKEAAAVRQLEAQRARDAAKQRAADARTREHELAVARGRLEGDALPPLLRLALRSELVCLALGKLLAPFKSEKGLVLLALHTTSSRPMSRRDTAGKIIEYDLVRACDDGARMTLGGGRIDEGALFDGDRPVIDSSRLTAAPTVDGPDGWEHTFRCALLPVAFFAAHARGRLDWPALGVERFDALLEEPSAGWHTVYIGGPRLDDPRGSIARRVVLRRPAAAEAA
jgi:hypothetical protein